LRRTLVRSYFFVHYVFIISAATMMEEKSLLTRKLLLI